MKISIVGTGYVGLVSGACLAEKGHHIVCVDLDAEKVAAINQGIPPIHEDGLPELLTRNISNGQLQATTDLRAAVLQSELSLIAVGTPFNGDEIDLKYIKAAAAQIGAILKEKNAYHVVVIKSTVVPGTSDEVVLSILESASGKKAGVDFGVGMNPEFLKEGEAIKDFMNPDRIVLGGIDERTIASLREVYQVFTGVDRLETNCKTAEMIKYTSNSLLATMISFANEIGNLCAAVGDVDVVDVMRGVHLDKRLTPIRPNGERIVPGLTTYIEAGCGIGGSCFPKDVKALAAYGAQKGEPMRLLESVLAVNAVQYRPVLTRLDNYFPANLSSVKVAVLGLAFKPGTDDMRESPSIPVLWELLNRNADVRAYDPVAVKESRKIFPSDSIRYCDSLTETIDGVDAVVIMTRWAEFKALPELLKNRPTPPVVIDGRRMLDKKSLPRYEGIGLSIKTENRAA